MNLDLGSFAFGTYLNSGTGTPSWGTALGQSQPAYKFTYPGAEVILIGMMYCSVPLNRVSLPLGKGGRVYKASEIDECQIASLFRKVYINGTRINYPFIMVLVKESSESHPGRKSIKYTDKITYSDDSEQYSNIDFIRYAQKTLGLTEEACWFVYSLEVYNQDELHMSAVIVDKDNSVTYQNSSERRNEWLDLIPDSSETSFNKTSIRVDSSEPLQQIFYGAPGTGKSHAIKRDTEGKAVVRTTFHPDSDYSTFVGAYKPAMKTPEREYSLEELVAKLNEIKLSGVTYPCHKFSAQYWKSLKKLTPEQIKQILKACGFTDTMNVEVGKGMAVGEELSAKNKEEQIIYKFIPQAFLKAYLGAWKKYADRATRTSVPLKHSFEINGTKYTITGVNPSGISHHRVFPFDIMSKSVTTVWNKIWSSGSFEIISGGPGVSVQQAIAQWIYDNIQNCTKQSLDEGLEAFKKSIEENGQVAISTGSQTYIMSKSDKGYIAEADRTCLRNSLQEYYNGNEPKSGAKELQRKLANLLREIDSSSFDNAWNRFADAINKNTDKVDLQKEESVLEPQFLVIEEINRGNCAQIFGDLFQLLDRGDNGFSEYPIEADSDLQQEIERAFKEEYKLYNDINIEGEIEDYTSNYGATLSEDVQSGRVLLLPKNLYIWATMNTSDQSLFPIDSAFKRRWDWQYIKIKNHPEENYQIVVGEEAPIPWYDFIKKINDIIASMTSSADKQLGYFFCKADKDGCINAKTFVSKVIFYLWNDVFKDYGFEDTSLFRYIDDEDGKEKDLTFPDFYDEDGEEVNETRLKDFIDKVLNWKKDKEEQK